MLFFIARMVSRFTLAGINFGPDDYTITVAMVRNICPDICLTIANICRLVSLDSQPCLQNVSTG